MQFELSTAPEKTISFLTIPRDHQTITFSHLAFLSHVILFHYEMQLPDTREYFILRNLLAPFLASHFTLARIDQTSSSPHSALPLPLAALFHPSLIANPLRRLRGKRRRRRWNVIAHLHCSAAIT